MQKGALSEDGSLNGFPQRRSLRYDGEFHCTQIAPRRFALQINNENDESKAVGDWMAERTKEGVLPHEFGVFVRSAAQLARARGAVKKAGLVFKILDEHVETTNGHVSISTMHLAKGLEFRAVVIMASARQLDYAERTMRKAAVAVQPFFADDR